MIKTAIIGLGKISKPHIEGLINNSDKYEIVAVCDIDNNLKKIADELKVEFYDDYKKISKIENLDLVLILTPPATHYEIAKSMLEHKKNVLIEKPGVLKIEHLYSLVEIAKENNVFMDVMYHWHYGSEVLYLKDKISTFGKIKKIQCNVFDPYAFDEKTIKNDFLALKGAWFDSGINILSMLIHFIDINKLELKQENIEYDVKSNLPVIVNKIFKYNDIEIEFNINWTVNKNHKFTNFYYDTGTLFVNHTAQEVWMDSSRVQSFYNDRRLVTHYTNMFRLLDFKSIDVEKTINLHKILLES